MIIITRKPESMRDWFLFNGGYDDRLNELEPQQWDDLDYRAGYAQCVCDLIDNKAYQPLSA